MPSRSNPLVTEARYTPDADAPDVGAWDRSGSEPRWRQDHLALVRGALRAWKGDPVEVSMHFEDERSGAPMPSSGTGKIRRAQAAALLWELDHRARPAPKPLYRGSHLDPIGEQAWSERKSVAGAWARRNAGRVFELPINTQGLRVADYIESELDATEREWIVRSSAGSRSNPSRATASSRRPFIDPIAVDPEDAKTVKTFSRAMRAFEKLLGPDDFDWRIAAKWQWFHAQLTPAEIDELRRIGRWTKERGIYEPPTALWRSAGVSGWRRGLKLLPDAEVIRYATGFRSWADRPNTEIFCKAAECVLYELAWPDDSQVLLDGRSVNAWLYSERPELGSVLNKAGIDGPFDGGEYLVEAPSFIVDERLGPTRHRGDSRSFFKITLRSDNA